MRNKFFAGAICAALLLAVVGVLSAYPVKAPASADKQTEVAAVTAPPQETSQEPAFDKSWPTWEDAARNWRSKRKENPSAHVDNDVILGLINQATEAREKADNYEASTKLEQATSLNANHSKAWLLLGDVYRDLSNKESALNAYITAEALTDNDKERASIYKGIAAIYEDGSEETKPLLVAALKKWLAITPDKDAQKKLDMAEGKILTITNFQKKDEGEIPEACVTFSWTLKDDGSVNYEDFISVEPAVKLAAIPSGKQLCLRGFSYGSSYKLTVKTSLPAQGNAKLAEDSKYDAAFADRAPRLSFQGNAYIIPRLNNLGAPLRGVNVDVAAVEILQINDRNLVSQIIRGDAMDSDMYDYNIDTIREDSGRSLWKGFINLKRTDNKTSITAIPFGQLIEKPLPGLYAIVARVAERQDETSTTNLEYQASDEGQPATQWLVVTDIGLITYDSQDGLHISARSYDSGKPANHIRLRLLSRDNTIISETETDGDGHAVFAAPLLAGDGGKAPKLLQAFGAKTESGTDFTFLDLQQPALDLSANDIGGRDAPAAMDAFIYSDRGIYRPGEAVQLSTLLRDNDGKAVTSAPPLTIKVLRPDGALYKSLVVQPHDAALGGYHTGITMPDNARMGVWRAEVFTDPTADRVGAYSWQVEDFVPARMEVRIGVENGMMLEKDKELNIPVQADYLYGAPAAKSRGDASLDLRLAAETPFKEFADYRFGLLDAKLAPEQVELKLDDTDDKGAASLAVALKDIPALSAPLEALLHVSVFDDTGRAVNRTAILPVNRTENYLGIKEASTADEAEWNTSGDRSFNIVALNRAGQAVAQNGLRYRLVREEYRYDWYSLRGNRNYQAQISDIPVTTGAVDVTAEKPADIALSNLESGTYRLEVFDPQQAPDRLTATSTRFFVGWRERPMTAKDKPDAVQLRLDRPQYVIGDTAKLFVKAPFEGEVEVVIAREKVLSKKTLHLPKDGVVIDVPVSDKWGGAGAYALVHAYRPGQKPVAGTKNPLLAPGRAAGVVWIGLNPRPRSFEITMEVPELVRPGQKLTVPVQVIGADSATEITVAAVDEGILQLTDFTSPDPEKYFYAKRRLSIDLRDSYGRLIDPNVDAIGEVRSGGDEASRATGNLPGKWIKPLALFSGPITLDDKGQAQVSFELPAFNGKLRLMAVAYSGSKLGHAEKKTTVRDQLVTSLALPRFLAPEDKIDALLNLDNIDGAAGAIKLNLNASGPVTIGDYPADITLQVKEKKQIPVSFTAQKPGVATIKMDITLIDGTHRSQEWPITVRAPWHYQTEQVSGQIKPGADMNIEETLLKNYYPEDAIMTVVFGPVPDLQMSRAIRELDRYPYGCLEQTSSRLLPLLYLGDLLDMSQIKDNQKQPKQRVIEQAISRILSMQKNDGSFSLWNGYGSTEPYLSLYAIDILQRATAQGYQVPAFALTNAFDWLQQQVKAGDYENPVLHRQAYAYYLLAKARMIEPGQIRYFAERYKDNLPNRQAQAFTAAALTEIGDAAKADPYWKEALKNADTKKDTNVTDYGDDLRDSLLALTLAAESGRDVQDFAAQLNGKIARKSYLSTQDNGWVILAGHALYAQAKPVKLSLNGEAQDAGKGPLLREWRGPDWSALPQAAHNGGDTILNYTVSVNAMPLQPPKAAKEGFTIKRSFYTRDGKEADLKNISANDMLIAVIEGQVTDSRITEQALVVDMLPAGFELESSRFGQGRNAEQFAWIGAMTPTTYQELRDDRFIAAFDPKQLTPVTENSENGEEAQPQEPAKPLESGQFRFAYVLRAVTKGDFALPAPAVDAMYQPAFRASGDPDRVIVK